MEWSSLASWWLDELAGDPAYAEEIFPLAMELLDPRPGCSYLDVGCGEGRIMAAIAEAGAAPIGVDVAPELLDRAGRFGEVHLAETPPLDFLEGGSVDGVVVVLVLEHIRDEEHLLAEAARVTRPGGVLALVVNHPIWTAPHSTPIQDGDSDEVLWRPGEYFSVGWSDEPAGDGTVRFHHRPLSRLLTGAAQAGWSLERLVEHGVSARQKEQIPGLVGQDHIPRVLGVRWVRSCRG